MSLIPSGVKRSTDATGDDIKTFRDADGKEIQATALVDADGNQVGTETSPVPVTLASFETNDYVEASATLSYVGKTDRQGDWLVVKVDTSNGVSLRYATAANNVGVATYADAWSARVTLTYGTYDEAF